MINNIWNKYPKEMRKKYIKFLKIYGSLSNLFNQKNDTHKNDIPQLDSKFQETLYQTCFNNKDFAVFSHEKDVGNTPHDILSTFPPDGTGVGIGLKTWRGDYHTATYQKVAQMKKQHNDINHIVNEYINTGDPDKRDLIKLRLVFYIASIKNKHLTKDYRRLEISPHHNIYSYVTRDYQYMTIQETNYPMIKKKGLNPKYINMHRGKDGPSSVYFYDGLKHYKFTFSESQCYMQFNRSKNDNHIDARFKVNVMDNPFGFLEKAFDTFIFNKGTKFKETKLTPAHSIIIPYAQPTKTKPIYLPMYSYYHGEKYIYGKSGLNARLGPPKNKNGGRPPYEIYIPVPSEFRKLNRHWFNPKMDLTNRLGYKQKTNKSSYTFRLHLPNGKTVQALIGQSRFKALESSPQSALGKWILGSLFHKKGFERIRMSDLNYWDWDSLVLWHQIPNDYKNVWIDPAPVNAYEHFINKEKRNK